MLIIPVIYGEHVLCGDGKGVTQGWLLAQNPKSTPKTKSLDT